MAIYQRSKGWTEKLKRAGLAIFALLLLFSCSVIQTVMEAADQQPVTSADVETVHQVPLGYRPLAVTNFVANIEKNDTYIFSISANDIIGRNKSTQGKYIRGNVVINNLRNKQGVCS